MNFELLGRISQIEIIAVGNSIRDIDYLRNAYGPGRWRKLKGRALVQLENGRIYLVEVHWYEAHGIGRRDMKIKRYLERRK
jgi:hypothetical protein